MAWISLLLASIFEVAWASSLKFISFTKIKESYRSSGFLSKLFWISVLPLLTYAICGICNIGLFSTATKSIPLAICYAVWMGLALFFQTMIDIFLFKENIRWQQIAFMSLIIIGVIGLRMSFHFPR